MNRIPDDDQLLSDVLSEASPADFREALLGETLQHVRRHRRQRQARRAAAAFAAVGLIGLLAWRILPPQPATPLVESTKANYPLVRTRPLPPGMITTTRPLTAQFLATRVAVPVIETMRTPGFRVINDDELLALVAPRPAALVRLSPEHELLVFANPEDERGFPLN